MTDRCFNFSANKGLEKKVSDAEEQKVRVEAELREKIKKMEKELENATMKAAGKNCCMNIHSHTLQMPIFILLKVECSDANFSANVLCFPRAGGSSLTEEQLDSMCPSAAAIAAIVKPGMKFFDVRNKAH